VAPGNGTCIKKPGSKGTDWRVHAIFDLGRGGFSHLELTDGKGAEALTWGAPVPGEVRIGDRGYCKAPALRRLRQGSGMKADFIVRQTKCCPADQVLSGRPSAVRQTKCWPEDQVLAVYRLRWQIELAFKRLKSLLHIDRLPSVAERGA